jgi:hypothetical protein
LQLDVAPGREVVLIWHGRGADIAPLGQKKSCGQTRHTPDAGGAYEPALQTTAPLLEHLEPPGHAMQTLCAVAVVMNPGEHGMAAEDPRRGQCLPMGQGFGDERPVVGQKLPAVHNVAAVEPLDGQK